MMHVVIWRIVCVALVGSLIFGTHFLESGTIEEEKIISYIKNDQPDFLVKYFGDRISLSLNGDGNLGIFNKPDSYDGFSQKKGYLYAMIYDTQEIKRLSGIPNIQSFKDAFKKGKPRIGRRSIQVEGEKLNFGIAFKKDDQGRITISAFDLEDVP